MEMSDSSPNIIPEPDHVVAKAPETANLTAESAEANERALRARLTSLQERGRRGANWFFWVAGLSLVNSVIIHTGGGIFFVVGMGATLIVDAVASGVAEQHPEAATIVRLVALIVD